MKSLFITFIIGFIVLNLGTGCATVGKRVTETDKSKPGKVVTTQTDYRFGTYDPDIARSSGGQRVVVRGQTGVYANAGYNGGRSINNYRVPYHDPQRRVYQKSHRCNQWCKH